MLEASGCLNPESQPGGIETCGVVGTFLFVDFVDERGAAMKQPGLTDNTGPPMCLSGAECAQISTLLADLGEDEQEAAQALRVNRLTLFRGLARRPLRASTIQCIRSRLQALEYQVEVQS